MNPGADGDGVPGRRDVDGARREDPDREHDDGDGGQDDRPDAARLRGRPGGRGGVPSAPREARDSLRDARGAPHGERRSRRRSSASRTTSTRSTAGTAGRQIVRRGEARATELAAGSLFVPLEGEAAVRAALVLEPAAALRPLPVPALQGARRHGRAPCRSCASWVEARSRDAIPAALDALLAEEIPPIDHVDLVLVRLPFVSPVRDLDGRLDHEGRAAPPARVRRRHGVGRVRGRPRSRSTRTRRRARPGTS